MYTLWFPSGALISLLADVSHDEATNDVPLKQRNRTAEMTINDRKMGWKCDSDREKRKYNSKIPTATWLSPKCAKRQVLKFKLRT